MESLNRVDGGWVAEAESGFEGLDDVEMAEKKCVQLANSVHARDNEMVAIQSSSGQVLAICSKNTTKTGRPRPSTIGTCRNPPTDILLITQATGAVLGRDSGSLIITSRKHTSPESRP